jgi:hypothetical protein
MHIFLARDWHGNLYITDDKDTLPPDVTDFHEVFFAERKPEHQSDDPTLSVDIKDYSEIISL